MTKIYRRNPGTASENIERVAGPSAFCHELQMTVDDILKNTRKNHLKIPALLVIDHPRKKYTIFYRDKDGANVIFGSFSHNLSEERVELAPSPAPLKKPSKSSSKGTSGRKPEQLP